MRGINKILLENILPAHVAEHYLLGVQGVSGILQDSNVIMLANHGIRHTYFLPNTVQGRRKLLQSGWARPKINSLVVKSGWANVPFH